MDMEIERKFLVAALPEKLEQYEKKEIEQTYISTDPTIRLRKSDNDLILTVKGRGELAREEFELPLTYEQYSSLMKKAETPAISKTRYIIPLDDGLRAELDVYHGRLDGLFTVEVEFESLEGALAFVPPFWFSRDVSRDSRYKNTALSLSGIPDDNDRNSL